MPDGVQNVHMKQMLSSRSPVIIDHAPWTGRSSQVLAAGGGRKGTHLRPVWEKHGPDGISARVIASHPDMSDKSRSRDPVEAGWTSGGVSWLSRS